MNVISVTYEDLKTNFYQLKPVIIILISLLVSKNIQEIFHVH